MKESAYSFAVVALARGGWGIRASTDDGHAHDLVGVYSTRGAAVAAIPGISRVYRHDGEPRRLH